MALSTDTKELRVAARMLAANLTAHEIVGAVNEAAAELRHEEETAKAHPLKGFRLPENQWCELAAHLRDGGGVPDSRMASKEGKSLDAIIHDAIMAGDQDVFWAELPHWVKSHWLGTGRVRALPGGGVSSGPHGPLDANTPLGEKGGEQS